MALFPHGPPPPRAPSPRPPRGRTLSDVRRRTGLAAHVRSRGGNPWARGGGPVGSGPSGPGAFWRPCPPYPGTHPDSKHRGWVCSVPRISRPRIPAHPEPGRPRTLRRGGLMCPAGTLPRTTPSAPHRTALIAPADPSGPAAPIHVPPAHGASLLRQNHLAGAATPSLTAVLFGVVTCPSPSPSPSPSSSCKQTMV